MEMEHEILLLNEAHIINVDLVTFATNTLPITGVITMSPARALATDRILGLHFLTIIHSSLESQTIFDLL